ncbi:MAG TPA: hypothetical protein VG734_17460 [Lacunisphaera sp.]|nr:hypothetical protein [Lacunisphaera sp.]
MNQTYYKWTTLPDIEVFVLSAPGYAQQGDIRYRGASCLKFLLVPGGRFGVFHLEQVVPDEATWALAHMISLHNPDTRLQEIKVLDPRVESQAHALLPLEIVSTMSTFTVSRWVVSARDDEAHLAILDDLFMPLAAPRFRAGRTNHQVLWRIADTAIRHKVMLLKQERPDPPH